MAVTGLRSLEAAFHGSILGAERERNPRFRPSSRNIQIIVVFLSDIVASIAIHARSDTNLRRTRVRYHKFIPTKIPLLNSTAVYDVLSSRLHIVLVCCCVNLRTSSLLIMQYARTRPR